MSWEPVSLLVGALMRGSKGRGEVVLPLPAVVAALAGVERVESRRVVAMSQVPSAGPTWAATPSSRRTGLSSVVRGEGAGLALIHHILAVFGCLFVCLLERMVGGKEERARWVVAVGLSGLSVVLQCWTRGNGVVLVPLGNHTDGGREELDFDPGPRAFLYSSTFSRDYSSTLCDLEPFCLCA
jgi:hypothetical protein